MQGAWGGGGGELLGSHQEQLPGAGIVLLILRVPVTGGLGCTWGGISRTPGLNSMERRLSPSSLGELSQCEPQPEPALTSAIFVCGLNRLHPADDPGSHCSWRTPLSIEVLWALLSALDVVGPRIVLIVGDYWFLP